MKIQKVLKEKKFIFSVIVVAIILVLAVIFLMSKVQSLLYKDAQANLQEIAGQNRDIILSRLNLEMNTIVLESEKIAATLGPTALTGQDFKDAIDSIKDVANADQFFLADLSGDTFFISPDTFNISGREYFKLALKGQRNVSQKLVSRLDGEDVFVISVPIVFENEVIGTCQKNYSTQQMYEMSNIPLFADKGYMHIINSEGYIVFSSLNQDYNYEYDNLYRQLFLLGNKDQSNALEEDVKRGESGYMETMRDGQKVFSVYMPVEGIHDWFLISSIPVNVVSPSVSIVVKTFYVILLIVILASVSWAVYFYIFKKKQDTKFKEFAFVDEVTGGNTFLKFHYEFKMLQESSDLENYSIAAFDIDKFKYINSYHGFKEGDKILKTIYDLVSSRLEKGEILSRISNDKFVMLVENTDSFRIMNLLKISMDDIAFTVNISCGVYRIEDKDEELSLMVDKALTASKEVKGSFRNGVAYYSSIDDKKNLLNEMKKKEIEKGLKNDNFIPYYQPQINIKTGEIVGAEALVRWRKNGQIVSPFEFIDICEQTGLIINLDNIVYEKVLQFLSRRLKAGKPCVPISVNMSRVHILDDDFVHNLVTLVEKYEIPPKYVAIELTESIIFERHDVIFEFVNHLHDHGIKVSIDDFGSGYSSLNMLKDIAVDVLKIDKGFLEDSLDKKRQQVILSSVMSMARELSIEVIMEGVETEENKELMMSIDCEIAQGYLYSRPITEEEFVKNYLGE